LSLVCLDVDDEDKSVVLLNLLHGALGVERVNNDLVLIKTLLMGNRLPWELRGSGELESLWLVEGGREADLADLVRVTLKARLVFSWVSRDKILTPFKVAFAAALALALPFPALEAPPIKHTHQQSLLTNSQYLLLLVRIPSTSPLYARHGIRKDCSIDTVVEDE
jgi:hypothetical protein